MAQKIEELTQEDILKLESYGSFQINLAGQKIEILKEDVEIITEDIPGELVANEGNLTVVLETTITEMLRHKGIAREFINRIQNLRKESGFDVTDKIHIEIQKNDSINEAIESFREYITTQTLAQSLLLVDNLQNHGSKLIDIDEDVQTLIRIQRIESSKT